MLSVTLKLREKRMKRAKRVNRAERDRDSRSVYPSKSRDTRLCKTKARCWEIKKVRTRTIRVRITMYIP